MSTPTRARGTGTGTLLLKIVAAYPTSRAASCAEIKFYGAFVLNRRVVIHAMEGTVARWRGNPSVLQHAS